MPFFEPLRGASIFALMTILVGMLPFATAILYVVRPAEHRLALMRPVSLASIFGSLCGSFSGFIAILRGIGVSPALTVESHRAIAIGFAEALVPIFLGFGFLTAAWLLVAVGMWRAER
jgi:hypothetical protein